MKRLISLLAVLLLAAGACPQTPPAKAGQPPAQQEGMI